MIETASIILNWNKPEMTICLIKQFLKFEKNNTNIIVADNNSKLEEREKLINYFKMNNWVILDEENIFNNKIKKSKGYLLLLNENYGYAKGNNFGLKFAVKLGYKYLLVSNNDIKLENPVISELIKILKSSKKIAVVGLKILGPNNKAQGPYRKPGILNEFFYNVFFPFLYFPYKTYLKYKNMGISKNKIYYPYRLMGCFMLMKADIIEKIDYFDENTFLYAEEPILAEKLKKFGYKMAYYDGVYVKHLHGVSTIEFGNKKKFYLQLESDLYYFKEYRNYSKFKLFLVELGRKAFFYIWKPLILKIKKVFRS